MVTIKAGYSIILQYVDLKIKKYYTSTITNVFKIDKKENPTLLLTSSHGNVIEMLVTIGPHKFFVVPPYFNATIYLTLEREPTALHDKYYIDLSL